MSWWKGDDDAPEHDKISDLGPDGGWLWTLANFRVSKQRTDGLVTVRILDDMLHRSRIPTPKRRKDAVAELVARQLWHDTATLRRCDRCKAVVALLPDGRLKAGEHYIHDFLEYNPASIEALVPEARMKANRKKELSRMKSLREWIWERDRGCCRYCGKRVDFLDRKTDDGGQHDHVDPADPINSADNIVISCRGCNRRKGDRTPEQWVAEDGTAHGPDGEGGRLLLPVPSPRDHSDVSGRDLSGGQTRTEEDLASRGGQIPLRDGPGRGQALGLTVGQIREDDHG